MAPEIRFRLAQKKDFSVVRGIVWDGLMSIEHTIMKFFVLRNYKVQGLILLVTVTVCSLLTDKVPTFFGVYLLGLVSAFGATHLWLVNFEVRKTPDLRNWREFEQTYRKFWVAEMKNNDEWGIVGTVAYQMVDPAYEPNSVEMKRVSVAAKVRHCGIGQQMVEFALKEAESCGFTNMYVSCSKLRIPAVKLYQKCGFRIVEDVVHTAGFGLFCYHSFTMKKRLIKP